MTTVSRTIFWFFSVLDEYISCATHSVFSFLLSSNKSFINYLCTKVFAVLRIFHWHILHFYNGFTPTRIPDIDYSFGLLKVCITFYFLTCFLCNIDILFKFIVILTMDNYVISSYLHPLNNGFRRNNRVAVFSS